MEIQERSRPNESHNQYPSDSIRRQDRGREMIGEMRKETPDIHLSPAALPAAQSNRPVSSFPRVPAVGLHWLPLGMRFPEMFYPVLKHPFTTSSSQSRIHGCSSSQASLSLMSQMSGRRHPNTRYPQAHSNSSTRGSTEATFGRLVYRDLILDHPCRYVSLLQTDPTCKVWLGVLVPNRACKHMLKHVNIDCCCSWPDVRFP
jgi:hypothetical protein